MKLTKEKIQDLIKEVVEENKKPSMILTESIVAEEIARLRETLEETTNKLDRRRIRYSIERLEKLKWE